MPVAYRPARFEALTGERIDELTTAGLQRLCDEGVAEAEDLEFKRKFYGLGHEQNAEIAKDISAMANGRGGVIVIGIRRSEPDGRAETVEPLLLSDGDADRLHAVVADRVAPVCEFEVRRVPPGTESGQYAILVPPSPLAPHAVMRDASGQRKEPLTYWIRNGATSRAMPEAEVADRYRTRFAASAALQERLPVILNDAATRLVRADQAWLQLAVVPSRPGLLRLEHRTRLRDYCLNAQRGLPPSPADITAAATATVGFRRVIVTEDSPYYGRSKYGAHFEFLDDGSVVLAVPIGRPRGQGDSHERGTSASEELAHRVQQWSLEAATLGCLGLAVRASADVAGAGGDAAVGVRLVTGTDSSLPLEVHRRLLLMELGSFQVLQKVPGSREVANPSLSVRTLPLVALSTNARELVSAAHMLLVDVLSEFGQPLVMACRDDGTLNAPALVTYAGGAQTWAEQHNVAASDID